MPERFASAISLTKFGNCDSRDFIHMKWEYLYRKNGTTKTKAAIIIRFPKTAGSPSIKPIITNTTLTANEAVIIFCFILSFTMFYSMGDIPFNSTTKPAETAGMRKNTRNV